MQKYSALENLKNAISPYYDYCDGYGNTQSSGNSYILGVNIGVGLSNNEFTHEGSSLLDEINSFDVAEIDEAYIGQINMSIVSSFCGPQGLIWGYDIAKHDTLYSIPRRKSYPSTVSYKGHKLKVYDGHKLIEATKSLFGTVDNRRFYLRPGAHVPFAGKNKKVTNKGIAYAGIAIGIPKNRAVNACLLMEDIGEIKNDLLKYNNPEDKLIENLAKSIIEIGMNQRVEFKEVFVAVKSIKVGDGQTGCALVAAPYFTLAQNALITDSSGKPDYDSMQKIGLRLWENLKFH